jgi:hypothetical protein
LAHPRIKKESDLVKKVPRAPLLELYTNYFFDSIPAVQKREIFEVLCFNFLLFMMNKKLQGSDVEDDSSYVNSWFLFDIIIKSMALHLAASNELGGMCVVQTIACIDMWTDCVRVVARMQSNRQIRGFVHSHIEQTSWFLCAILPNSIPIGTTR